MRARRARGSFPQANSRIQLPARQTPCRETRVSDILKAYKPRIGAKREPSAACARKLPCPKTIGRTNADTATNPFPRSALRRRVLPDRQRPLGRAEAELPGHHVDRAAAEDVAGRTG